MNRLSDNEKKAIAIFQLLLVGLYFVLYYFMSIYAALLLALFFVIADIFAWKKALRLYVKDENFAYLGFTLFTSMLAIIFMFANSYELTSSIKNGSEIVEGLWEHVYFSIVTFTTLGYGDYVPTGIAKIIVSIQAIFGFVYFAFIVGVLGSVFYARIEKT